MLLRIGNMVLLIHYLEIDRKGLGALSFIRCSQGGSIHALLESRILHV